MHMELEAQKLLMTKNSLAELIPKIFHASVTISEIQENITLFELPDINYNKMMEKSAILATEVSEVHKFLKQVHQLVSVLGISFNFDVCIVHEYISGSYICSITYILIHRTFSC